MHAREGARCAALLRIFDHDSIPTHPRTARRSTCLEQGGRLRTEAGGRGQTRHATVRLLLHAYLRAEGLDRTRRHEQGPCHQRRRFRLLP